MAHEHATTDDPAPLTARTRAEASDVAGRFRPTRWSAFQAWRIKLWLSLLGMGLFRLRIEVEGIEHIPPEKR